MKKFLRTDEFFSTPFDAIADFARRTTGGGGGRSRRDDSRDRDLRFTASRFILTSLAWILKASDRINFLATLVLIT